MPREDVEDQRGAVDDLDADDVLQLPPLRGGELGVGDDGVGLEAFDDPGELAGLARAEVGGRIRQGTALDEPVEDDRPGGLGQGGELAQRLLGLGERAAARQADEDDPLQAHPPVFDVDALLAGDSRVQACDPLEGGAGFAREGVSRPVLAVDGFGLEGRSPDRSHVEVPRAASARAGLVAVAHTPHILSRIARLIARRSPGG